MGTNLKILIADDHPMLLKGLADAFRDAGYSNLMEASNGAQALEKIVEMKPAIAILDIEMPLLSGFEVIAKCKDLGLLKTKFVIITSFKEKSFVMKAKKLNISGYLLKDEPFSEIHKCVQAIASGKSYFSQTFDQIFNAEIAPHIEKIKFLSPSERTIIRLIAQGNSSREIGDLLTISFRTVQKHRANIIAKLDLDSSSDSLSIWTIEHKELILSL